MVWANPNLKDFFISDDWEFCFPRVWEFCFPYPSEFNIPFTIGLLEEEVRSGPLVRADETVLQVLKEPGRAATTKSYM